MTLPRRIQPNRDDEKSQQHHTTTTQEFVCRFVQNFAPLNNGPRVKYPRAKKGKFKGVCFSITETRSTYAVEVNGQSRRFTSAWRAGQWVYGWVLKKQRERIALSNGAEEMYDDWSMGCK